MITITLLFACTGNPDPVGPEGSQDDTFTVSPGTDGSEDTDGSDTTDTPEPPENTVVIRYQTWDTSLSCFGDFEPHYVNADYWAPVLAAIPTTPAGPDVMYYLALTTDGECVSMTLPFMGPEVEAAVADPFFNGDQSLFPDCHYEIINSDQWCEGVEAPSSLWP